MIRLLVVAVFGLALVLAAAVTGYVFPKDPPPAPVVEPVSIRALRVIREAYPAAVSLPLVAQLIGETPGTVALDLAGNPSVRWEFGADKVTRYYRIIH